MGGGHFPRCLSEIDVDARSRHILPPVSDREASAAQLLVGFNLGVEVGQLTVVLAVLGLVWVLVRLRLALPRPIVVDVAASMLIGLGLYWFVSRSFIAA